MHYKNVYCSLTTRSEPGKRSKKIGDAKGLLFQKVLSFHTYSKEQVSVNVEESEASEGNRICGNLNQKPMNLQKRVVL
jgi:hypothetical protein